MKYFKFFFVLLLPGIISCKIWDMAYKNPSENIEVHGHRGDRGNFPENSIRAFLSAVEKGVDFLEMDVVISQDGKVVVSHEPYMSSQYMLKPNGEPILVKEERDFNLFEMSYDSIKKFDAGSLGNSSFPKQQKLPSHKPLLVEVFDMVENYLKSHDRDAVGYNIELKSVPETYGIYHPFPEEFVDLVMSVIQDRNIQDKVIIQSFDAQLLNILRKKYPEITISFLVGIGGVEENLPRLDFTPEIYSPNYTLLTDKQTVESIQSLDMKVIPYTVNSFSSIKTMISFEVDGIITDYPERVLKLLDR